MHGRNEKESFREVADTPGKESSCRLSALYKIQVHPLTFSGEVSSPRPANTATQLINIFTLADPAEARVTLAKPKWSTLGMTRRDRRVVRIEVFSHALHVFQWRSQLCDKVHFARPTGW